LCLKLDATDEKSPLCYLILFFQNYGCRVNFGRNTN